MNNDMSGEIQEELPNIVERGRSYFLQNDFMGLDTGFKSLNRCLGGLCKGEVTLLVAGSQMKKSTLAINMAQRMVWQNDYRVLYVSTVQNSESILYELVSLLSRIDLRKIKSGLLTDEEYEKVEACLTDISNMRSLRIENASGEDEQFLESLLMEMPQTDMLIIDIANRINVGKQQCPLAIIKQMAQQYKVAVLALYESSQLLKTVGQLANNESVDNIISLYQDEFVTEDTCSKGLAEISILKCAHGRKEMVELAYLSDICMFAELEPI